MNGKKSRYVGESGLLYIQCVINTFFSLYRQILNSIKSQFKIKQIPSIKIFDKFLILQKKNMWKFFLAICIWLICCNAISTNAQMMSQQALKNHVTKLVVNGNKNGILALLKKAKFAKERQEQAKMKKCLEVFKSYDICNQRSTLFIWAKMAAADMMNE